MKKQCYDCGANIEDTDVYCRQCGKPVEAETNTQHTDKTVQDAQNMQNDTWEKAKEQDAAEIQDDTPLSFGTYMLLFLLMIIPVVNIVLLCMWAFGKRVNTNKRNFSRAALVYMAIGIVLSIVIGIAVFFSTIRYMQYMQYFYEPIGVDLYQDYDHAHRYGCQRFFYDDPFDMDIYEDYDHPYRYGCQRFFYDD